jgi:hypothetical protein
MSDRTFVEGNFNSADHQFAACLKAVQIVADAGAAELFGFFRESIEHR